MSKILMLNERESIICSVKNLKNPHHRAEVQDIHSKFEIVIFRLIDLVIFVWLFNLVIFKFSVKLSKMT